MKKILPLLVFCFSVSMSHFVLGQKLKKYEYAKLVERPIAFKNKVEVEIDYGQNSKYLEDQRIREENGKIKTFNSMIDALNYMGENGWEFVQAYPGTSGGVVSSTTQHWILKRPLEYDLETTDLPKTKRDFKKTKNL
ncbi:hypothetical protein [Xanthovirga aplysinae]|uniref:hypothetical protein n=1 Tax=Xanthovirga aplysinae TaxID=2529853 RepID=UPI0012BD0219|nr:hypothetical protein [Xanthovirga aplysinae]MTI30716.1 hypothetical protein [Xanthovirga aplysinae]